MALLEARRKSAWGQIEARHCTGSARMPKLRLVHMGGAMFARLCGAAIIAALVSLSSASSYAQQQPGPGSQNAGSYLPPAHFIAKEEHAKTSRKAAPAKPEAGQKTIGLVSLLGDAATVKKVGVMVFGNELHKVPIPSWKLDEQVSGLVQQMLKKTFRIKTIPVPAEAFDKFNAGSFFLKSYDDELLKFLSGYVGTQHCDYYLLVLPAFDRVGTTNQEVGGVGVLRLESVFTSNPEYIYAFYRLAALDGHLKPLRAEFGFRRQAHPDAGCAERAELQDEGWRTASRRRQRRHRRSLAPARSSGICSSRVSAKTLPKLFSTS